MNELALFAGGGGGILGGKILGWKTICAVECDWYAATVLAQRQNDGYLPAFPIWDDIRTFEGRPWRGRVDVVSGGFPCQDISVAGKGAGIDGERSGLWDEMARVIGEVRPRFAFVENSPALTFRGLGRVLGDLSEMGFDAEWGIISAADVGASHVRKRIWILAYQKEELIPHANCEPGIAEPKLKHKRPEEPCGSCKNGMGAGAKVANTEIARCISRGVSVGDEAQQSKPLHNRPTVPYTNMSRCEMQRLGISKDAAIATAECGHWWATEPGMGRMVDGLANRVDRLKTIGNGQVPHAMALAWETLYNRIDNHA